MDGAADDGAGSDVGMQTTADGGTDMGGGADGGVDRGADSGVDSDAAASGTGGGSGSGGSGGGTAGAGGGGGGGGGGGAQIALTVIAKDDGILETNITKPRITVENTGTMGFTGFEVRYYFTVTENLTPVIDVYYNPEAQLSLVQETATRWYVRESYTRALAPGESTESGDGLTYGLHFTTWAPWNKDDDESHLGLTATMAATQHIDVFDAQGRLIYGDITP